MITILALVACGPSATSLELQPTEIVVASKSEPQLVTAIGKDSQLQPASSVGVVWTSSDPAVATVENVDPPATPDQAQGKVSGVGSGHAIITATLGEKVAGTANVSVNLVAKGEVRGPAFLAPGATGKIAYGFWNEKNEVATATPTCTIADAAVATLADTTITAVGPGIAKIECKTGDVAFDTSVAVLGTNAAPLAIDPREAQGDYDFVRQSIGLLPEIKTLGIDNVKITRWTAGTGKPRFTYELCGTPKKMEMTLKNLAGDSLPVTITGPCPANAFAYDALPWKGAPWLALLVEADKRGQSLAKSTLAISAASPDTWTISSGKVTLVSKAGVIQ